MSDEWKERKLLGILDIFWDCVKKNLGDELVIAEYNGHKNQEEAIRANLLTYKKVHQHIRKLIIQQKLEIDDMEKKSR